MSYPIRKALTFRASSIGDCLMGKYVLENVHTAFPDVRAAIIVGSRGAMLRDLFAAYPWLEVREATRKDRTGLQTLWQDFHGADFVLTQYAGKPGGKFSATSKVAARVLAHRGALIGFRDASKWTRFFYDHLVPFDIRIAPAEHERRALAAAGIPVLLPYPTLAFVPDEGVFERFRVEKGKYLIAHFFAGNKGRSLSPEKQRELLEALRKQFSDLSVLISGGPQDKGAALASSEGMDGVRVIAGEASLQEVMNLIGSARGVVSVDTGIAHMTAQLGKPLVVLATCLGPNWWEPRQYGPAPNTFLNRADLCVSGHVFKDFPDCLNEVSMQSILAAANERFVR